MVVGVCVELLLWGVVRWWWAGDLRDGGGVKGGQGRAGQGMARQGKARQGKARQLDSARSSQLAARSSQLAGNVRAYRYVPMYEVRSTKYVVRST